MLCIFVIGENNSSGNVFGIIFNACDKKKFALSNIIIGKNVLNQKPCLEGDWADIRIFTSPEPCLLSETNWADFIPSPFPNTVSCVLLITRLLYLYG